jgi:general L-amino acid transport system permease protein
MAVGVDRPESDREAFSAASILYHPRFRAIVSQILLALVLILFFSWIINNAVVNLRRAHIASGFGFLSSRAGFDVSQSLIPYSAESSYGRAFLVGLLNTILVAVIGIIIASVLGFALGVARLSKNWLVARLATVYVETLRNIPVLLQLLFWYKAVLALLPSPRQAYELPFGANLSNRGLLFPRPIPGTGFTATFVAFIVAILATFLIRRWAKQRQAATGEQFPTLWVGLGLIVLVPVAVFFVTGMPLSFEMPVLQGFNFVGGVFVRPEFLALVLGLSLYTAAFIAEVVRGGILAVSHGQTEAAYALGLPTGRTLRLIIIPQALRVIIPPLTNQYLNLTKNSSLAVAIGYPDLVGVFAGTVLNQTGQAVEVLLITMLVYLGLSLATSVFMNWFNRRVALRER